MSDSVLTCPKCQTLITGDLLTEQIESQVVTKYRQKMIDWQSEKEKSLSSELEAKIKTQLLKQKESETKALMEELAEKNAKLQASQDQELLLRKEKRELEEAKREFELTSQRRLDEERQKIKEAAARETLDQYRLKDAEKDKQMDGMRKTIEELQLKSQLTSQQLQGEVLELELENLLKAEFPYDNIVPVPKGVTGADLIQKVIDTQGRQAGTIVWESKRTKHWDESWIQKLKDDARAQKADVSILVSIALPEGIKYFAPREGILVTSYDCAIALAHQSRKSLIELQLLKLSQTGKNEKVEMLYEYLSGTDFRSRIESLVEGFAMLRKQLDEEKRVFEKQWAAREKALDRLVRQTSGMYGDFQGLIGASLDELPSLSPQGLLDSPEQDQLV